MDLTQRENGLLALSWYSGESIDIQDQEIAITLNFTANQSLESLENYLSLSDMLVSSGAWHGDLQTIGVDLEIEILTNTLDSDSAFKLFQNQPNPFRSNSLISFSLPEAERGTLSIYDISGKLIYQVTENYHSGYHEVTIDRSQLSGGGVYIYQFKTDKYHATKKMTLLN